MYAVIKTGGKQYRVREGDELLVERLSAETGEAIQFVDVLMLGGEAPVIGAPRVDGAAVAAEVVEHPRGPKVYNFKKRRRKHSSKRLKGHRQDLTLVRITGILSEGADPAKAAIGAGQSKRAARAEAQAPEAPAE